MTSDRLGVGFVGSGFIARFHMLGWKGVRDADVLGVWSPNAKNAAAAARYANDLEIGAARVYTSIGDMVADPAIDAIWLTGPNQTRIENVQEIVDALERGRGTLKGIACEKPLARNVAEAKELLRMVKNAGIMHGYLEDQAFAPQVDPVRPPRDAAALKRRGSKRQALGIVESHLGARRRGLDPQDARRGQASPARIQRRFCRRLGVARTPPQILVERLDRLVTTIGRGVGEPEPQVRAGCLGH